MIAYYDADQVVIKVHYHLAPNILEVGKPERTLCGKLVNEILFWDYPTDFFRERVPSNATRCQKCMDHPEYPLMLLGALP